MIIICQCGVKFNPETSKTEKCPICFFKKNKKPRKPRKTDIRTIRKRKRIYLKAYFKLPKFKKYRREYARKQRQKQRELYGHTLW